MRKSILIEIIGFLLIILFVYAALSKLLDYERFQVQLGKSSLIEPIAPIVAWLLPILELAVSVFLVMPRFRLLGLYSAFFLMVLFTEYIITILRFADHIPCSCGGILQSMTWSQHLIFNIAIVILIALTIIFFPSQGRSSVSGIHPV